MKNWLLLVVNAVMLIVFYTNSLSVFADESKIFWIQGIPQDEVEKNVAEYCHDEPYKNSSYSVISDEEYAVYAELIEELSKSQNLESMNVDKKIFSICKEDSQEYFLEREIPTKVTVNVNTTEEVEQFNSNHRVHGYHMGQFGFSRVAFNKDYTQAFVYSSYFCGPLCSSGQSNVFTKESGKWRKSRTAITRRWIS